MKSIESTLLIDLDSLFDSRMGTLFTLDPAYFTSTSKTYHQRACDAYVGLETEEFFSHYARRNKTVLKNSLMTPMVHLIRDFIKLTLMKILDSPHVLSPKLTVNTYPYVLTPDEQTLLLKSLIAMTDDQAGIELIHRSLEEITPVYLKSEIALMTLYRYTDWLDYHAEKGHFDKHTCPEVTLLGPKIYFKTPEPPTGGQMCPFDAMQLLAGPLIGLRLVPVEYFSYQQVGRLPSLLTP